MAKGDDIQERLIQFAARIINMCDALPHTLAGRHVGKQILRSGTAPAPHHGESQMLPTSKLTNLVDECNQLQRILSTSIKTARQSANH